MHDRIQCDPMPAANRILERRREHDAASQNYMTLAPASDPPLQFDRRNREPTRQTRRAFGRRPSLWQTQPDVPTRLAQRQRVAITIQDRAAPGGDLRLVQTQLICTRLPTRCLHDLQVSQPGDEQKRKTRSDRGVRNQAAA